MSKLESTEWHIRLRRGTESERVRKKKYIQRELAKISNKVTFYIQVELQGTISVYHNKGLLGSYLLIMYAYIHTYRQFSTSTVRLTYCSTQRFWLVRVSSLYHASCCHRQPTPTHTQLSCLQTHRCLLMAIPPDYAGIFLFVGPIIWQFRHHCWSQWSDLWTVDWWRHSRGNGVLPACADTDLTQCSRPGYTHTNTCTCTHRQVPPLYRHFSHTSTLFSSGNVTSFTANPPDSHKHYTTSDKAFPYNANGIWKPQCCWRESIHSASKSIWIRSSPPFPPSADSLAQLSLHSRTPKCSFSVPFHW